MLVPSLTDETLLHFSLNMLFKSLLKGPITRIHVSRQGYQFLTGAAAPVLAYQMEWHQTFLAIMSLHDTGNLSKTFSWK